MSMENAILEHAGALKELAAAIRSMGATVALTPLHGEFGSGAVDTVVEDKAAELAAATEQRAAAAREAQKKDEATVQDGDVTQVIPREVIEQAKADQAAEVVKEVSDEIEEKGTVAADLDYAKDVRPVLLAAIKKAGKEAVAAMIGKYGVDKADKLKVEQLPAVLAEAQALAA